MLHDVTHAGDVLPLMRLARLYGGLPKAAPLSSARRLTSHAPARCLPPCNTRHIWRITVSEQIQNKRAKQGVNSPEMLSGVRH